MGSCRNEEKKRKTYQNQHRLAKISKRAFGCSYVIYRTVEGLYEICRTEDYRAEKGVKIEDV